VAPIGLGITGLPDAISLGQPSPRAEPLLARANSIAAVRSRTYSPPQRSMTALRATSYSLLRHSATTGVGSSNSLTAGSSMVAIPIPLP
jgi:hypothetical protein